MTEANKTKSQQIKHHEEIPPLALLPLLLSCSQRAAETDTADGADSAVVSEKSDNVVADLQAKADDGDPDAQVALGKRYYAGDGVEQSYEKADYWYRNAIDGGSEEAQYLLGRCYEEGRGEERSVEEAFDWYRRSADQGFAEGQYAVGRCYELGIGAEVSRDEARRYYQMAADQGLAKAQSALENY